MTESELEKILVEEVRKAGGRAYKWVSPGNIGVPDRIVFFPGGKVYYVELKTERGSEGYGRPDRLLPDDRPGDKKEVMPDEVRAT